MSIVNINALKQNGCQLWWKGSSATGSMTTKAITPYGGITQILPSGGAGVGIFDGTGDWLKIPMASDFQFGSSDFTIESQVYIDINQPTYTRIYGSISNYTGVELLFDATTNCVYAMVSTNGTSYITAYSSPAACNLYAWNHVAVVRYGTSLKVYVNGIGGTANTVSGSLVDSNQSYVTIGAASDNSYPFRGKLSELRVSNVARYTANFTPQYRQLENDSNTKLLLHFTPTGTTFIDSSSSNHTVAPSGDAKCLSSPVGSGVAAFDGNGDYLSIGTTAQANEILSSSTWTIEYRFYQTSADKGVLCGVYASDGYNALLIGTREDRYLHYQFCSPASGWYNGTSLNVGSTLYPLNQWNHVVITRDGNASNSTIKGYLNGELDYTYAIGTRALRTGAGSFEIGRRGGGEAAWDLSAYVSEYRISSNQRYTTTFTPSNQPFAPDSYTKLLLHMDGVGNAFYDSSDPPGDNGFPILPDGVTVTPTGTFAVQKMKDGRNIWKFDGSTNYITVSDHAAWAMFENDFTISAWVKFASIASNYILGQIVSSAWADFWCISIDASNILYLVGAVGGTENFRYSITAGFTAGNFHHITIIKNGTSCLMYVDGIQKTVTTTTAWRNTTNIAALLTIGSVLTGYHNGNIKDLMIFKKALTQDQIAAIYRETYIY